MRPLDPAPAWPIVGVTGIPRLREWDAVVTAEAPGLMAGSALTFVALEDGRVLPTEAGPLAAALDDVLERPYRAEAVHRTGDLWAAGARRIETVELRNDPGGDEAELVWDGRERSFRVDGEPRLGTSPELEEVGRARANTYVVRATRLAGRLWAIETAPL